MSIPSRQFSSGVMHDIPMMSLSHELVFTRIHFESCHVQSLAMAPFFDVILSSKFVPN